MNIAFVCNEYPPARGGGIGPAVRALARGLVAQGHRAFVIGLYPETSIEDDAGVMVYRLAFPMRSFVKRELFARRHLHQALVRLCRRHTIDVVEWPDFQGLFHAPITGVTDVLKLHGTTLSHRVHGLIRPRWPAQWAWERNERRTMHAMRCWVGVSEWFLQEWKGRLAVIPAVEAVVHNPVDPTVFYPPQSRTQRERTVLYCGAFRERKGVRTLVQAAHELFSASVDFRLVLVGFEAEWTCAELLALAPGHAGRIKFLPFASQARVAELMRSSMVFAMPSHYESCGNGWLEAAMCGTPLIGSTASCGPEMVRHGIDGLLVAPDDVVGTARAIAMLLNDGSLWESMSNNCLRDAASRFGVSSGVQRSLAFYAESMRAMKEPG